VIPIKVLSLFDGMSCGMLAMKKAGITVDRYVAYEIDKYAIQTAKHNFPEIEEMGDVFSANFTDYYDFDYLVGGSPCTYWSIAQTKNRETVASGMGWDLFSQYVRALNEAKPKFFIYENNKSMSAAIRKSICDTFGFEPVLINSALVSAQNRQRLYWAGKRNDDGTYSKVDVEQPKDKEIYLKDILDGFCETTKFSSEKNVEHLMRKFGSKGKIFVGEDKTSTLMAAAGTGGGNHIHYAESVVINTVNNDGKKARTLMAGYYKYGLATMITNDGFKGGTTGVAESVTNPELITEIPVYKVENKQIHIKDKTYPLNIADGYYTIRKLTVSECKRLQTVPDDYEFPVSNSQAYKMLGNGWTVDVITHLIKSTINCSNTYVSLFSSAGIGCYGFKMNGFECIATNELLPQRMEIQKTNHKCKYESGYICGDITKEETQKLLLDEIEMWKDKENLKQVDVLFATPPCQGMSSANQNKNGHDQIRNSLIVQAIKMVDIIRPKVFVFENVRSFLKTDCIDSNGDIMTIQNCIEQNLSQNYNIHYKVINFKDYGVPPSRTRTLVVGTNKECHNLSPLSLFPTRQKEITLRESIGNFASLGFGEKDAHDPFHFSRKFPERALEWVTGLKEGQSAFDLPIDRQPYKIDKDGNKTIIKEFPDKFRRMYWDKPANCITTRNDTLSSQSTIHPHDDRVFSIRELMRVMSIPDTFKWTDADDDLTVENSDLYLKKNELNIRRCIGESVPTEIGRSIGEKVKNSLECFENQERIFNEIKDNFDSSLNNIRIEISNTLNIVDFITQIASFYAESNSVVCDIVCTDENTINDVKNKVRTTKIGVNVTINFIPTNNVNNSYDYYISDGHFVVKNHQFCLF